MSAYRRGTDRRDIGYVESLCPGVPPPPGLTPSLGPSLPNSTPSSRQPSVAPGQIPALTPSPQPPFPPNGFYANANGQRTASQPIQGFTPRNDFRRKSSGTSTMTTTTTTTFDQQAHAQNQLNARPQSMQSKPNVAFPMASPAPALQRSSTGRMREADHSVPQSPVDSNDDRSRFIQSPDMGHRDDPKRYSTGTTATFGRWDKDLRMAMAKGDTGGLVRIYRHALSSRADDPIQRRWQPPTVSQPRSDRCAQSPCQRRTTIVLAVRRTGKGQAVRRRA